MPDGWYDRVEDIGRDEESTIMVPRFLGNENGEDKCQVDSEGDADHQNQHGHEQVVAKGRVDGREHPVDNPGPFVAAVPRLPAMILAEMFQEELGLVKENAGVPHEQELRKHVVLVLDVERDDEERDDRVVQGADLGVPGQVVHSQKVEERGQGANHAHGDPVEEQGSGRWQIHAARGGQGLEDVIQFRQLFAKAKVVEEQDGCRHDQEGEVGHNGKLVGLGEARVFKDPLQKDGEIRPLRCEPDVEESQDGTEKKQFDGDGAKKEEGLETESHIVLADRGGENAEKLIETEIECDGFER